MTAIRRWIAVLLAVVVLVSIPVVVGRLPARAGDLTVDQLLAKVNGSKAAGFSGYAESSGTLSLPITGEFETVADLFGGRTQLRVWWRSSTEWRVDSINPGGEADLIRQSSGTWSWDFEKNRAQFSAIDDGAVRLPVAPDLLPTELGRRLLSESAAELSKLGSKRVAGLSAVGVRMRPTQPQSTIRAVDVYLDPASGLPLRVQVFARGIDRAVLTSQFLDFSAHLPGVASTSFTPPAGADVRDSTPLDIAGAISRFVRVRPPTQLAGLSRNPDLQDVNSVGVYGNAVTELIAVPLPVRYAGGLRDQLRTRPNVTETDDGLLAEIGPLSLFLSDRPAPQGRVTWLVLGTVTPATVQAAAKQLDSAA